MEVKLRIPIYYFADCGDFDGIREIVGEGILFLDDACSFLSWINLGSQHIKPLS